MSINELHDFLMSHGIKNKIKIVKDFNGSTKFEIAEIKIKKDNRLIIIRAWTYPCNYINYVKDGIEHQTDDGSVKCNEFELTHCIVNEKGVFPPFDSHVEFPKSYQSIMDWIIKFLGIEPKGYVFQNNLFSEF